MQAAPYSTALNFSLDIQREISDRTYRPVHVEGQSGRYRIGVWSVAPEEFTSLTQKERDDAFEGYL